MSDQMKVAIIGCGVIAPTHIEGFQHIDDVEVTLLCDLKGDRAGALAEKYGIGKTTEDAQDVFNDPEIQAVSICTDHASHVALAIEALKAGKHVLAEKPLGAHLDSLHEAKLAQEQHADLVFAGIFQHRFNPIFQALRAQILSGAFGTVLTGGVRHLCQRPTPYYAESDWRGSWKQEGGSLLINQAIHMIDILCWVMGGATAVCGLSENRTHDGVIETEDTAVATLKFANGSMGILEATSSSHLKWKTHVHVHTDQAVIDVDNDEITRADFDDDAMAKLWEEALQATEKEKSPQVSGKSYYGGQHGLQIADFIAAIREGRSPYVKANSAIHAVEVVKAVYESSKTGQWVEIQSRP